MTSTQLFERVFKWRYTRTALLGILVITFLFFVCNDVFMPLLVRHGGTVEVPSVLGISFDEAEQRLDSLGLEARQGELRTSESSPAGTVIAQNPSPGTAVKTGRRIYLTVSGGEQLVQVPNLKGKTVRDAKFALERNGLKIGGVSYALDYSFPVNTIIDQSVPAYSKINRGMHVSVIVSQGDTKDQVSVPDVIGKTLTEAGRILANHGLRIGTLNYESSTVLLPNTIVDQFPRSGDMVEHGRTIDLFVVRGGEKKKPATEN